MGLRGRRFAEAGTPTSLARSLLSIAALWRAVKTDAWDLATLGVADGAMNGRALFCLTLGVTILAGGDAASSVAVAMNVAGRLGDAGSVGETGRESCVALKLVSLSAEESAGRSSDI